MKYICFAALVFFISGCSFHENFIRPNYMSKEMKLRLIAKEWEKTPYVLGGMSKKWGADCSAFTQSALAQLNIRITRTTQTQLHSGMKVSRSKLKVGDLVFFKTGRGPHGMHVGIYTSKGRFIHLSTKGGVKEARLDNAYWKVRYIGARRY